MMELWVLGLRLVDARSYASERKWGIGVLVIFIFTGNFKMLKNGKLSY